MQNVMPEVAELVPTAISYLMLFVFVVAGTTIAYLTWRASRGARESRDS